MSTMTYPKGYQKKNHLLEIATLEDQPTLRPHLANYIINSGSTSIISRITSSVSRTTPENSPTFSSPWD
jgi:hypothetical protein